MRIIAFKKILLSLTLVVLLIGCKGPEVSSTTGWNYNDSEWGGYESAKPNQFLDPSGMMFVEGGNYVMGQTTDNARHDWNNQPRLIEHYSHFSFFFLLIF